MTMKLYSNINTISTPQIAVVSIDQNWRQLNPWHVTFGFGGHEVYSTQQEAFDVADRVAAEITEWVERFGYEFMPDYSAPRVFPNASVQDSYDRRERKNAEHVVFAAKKLFSNERVRAAYGYQTWIDCIQRGVDRIRTLYPDLIVE